MKRRRSKNGGKTREKREIEERRDEVGREGGREAAREWKRGTFNFAVSQAIHTITFC